MKGRICIVLALFCFSLVGCGVHENAEDAKLKTEAEVKKLVNETYGNAVLVSKESLDKSSVVYTFQDVEYGFNYTYTTKVDRAVTIDNPSWDYREMTITTFNKEYYNNFCSLHLDELATVLKSYGDSVIWMPDNYKIRCKMFKDEVEKSDKDEEIVGAAKDIFNGYDKRNFWTSERFEFKLYNVNEVFLEEYDIKGDFNDGK